MNGTRLTSKVFGDLVRQIVFEYDLEETKIASMMFRREVWDLDLLVDADEFFAVGTRTKLFKFGDLDDVFRINLIGMIGLGGTASQSRS